MSKKRPEYQSDPVILEDKTLPEPAPEPIQMEVPAAPGLRIVLVFRNYRGRLSHEQVIVAGEYAEDDPRLFGLATYLVTNGHARWIE